MMHKAMTITRAESPKTMNPIQLDLDGAVLFWSRFPLCGVGIGLGDRNAPAADIVASVLVP